MSWIKKNQSSLHKRHTGQELCLAVNPSGTTQNMRVLIFIRLSFHVVGKVVCLVMLWPNPARRDKPWNYIPPEFQRYTKPILATGNQYGHVENVWDISFSKKKKVEILIFGQVIPRISFGPQIDYKLIDFKMTLN
jgi:hypothetical protein